LPRLSAVPPSVYPDTSDSQYVEAVDLLDIKGRDIGDLTVAATHHAADPDQPIDMRRGLPSQQELAGAFLAGEVLPVVAAAPDFWTAG